MRVESKKELCEQWKEKWVTALLVLVNCVVYFMMELMGDTENTTFLITHGASFVPCIQENNEYWRLFTSTFLHSGLMHLVNNMIMLIAAGQILEKALGHVRFLLLYLLSALTGSALSYFHLLQSEEFVAVVGASGAIFGVFGALLWVVIRNKGKYESLSAKGLLFMIILSVYYGINSNKMTSADPLFAPENIDNWGHIGGLLGGFILSIIFYRYKEQND